jgi:NAD(P)H-hydrate epimerase
MGGAALLCADSALRAGAGLVSLATRAEHVAAALVRRPEIMCAALASANQLLRLVERADVCVVGPGLGQGAWSRSLLSGVAGSDQPQVWDADALNLLAAGQVSAPRHGVLTPHPGEAARLLGIDVGMPLMRIQRHAFVGQRLMDYSVSLYRADRYKLWVPLERVRTSTRRPAASRDL